MVEPISPDGPIRLAISMDDLLLWPDMPLASGYTHLGITQAMTDAMKRHKVAGTYAFSATSPAEGRPDLSALSIIGSRPGITSPTTPIITRT